jgi:hypothetical protein
VSGSPSFPDGSTLDLFGKEFPFAQRTEEIRTAFCLRKHNRRLVTTAKLNVQNVGAIHAAILETHARNLIPTKCLIELRVHSLDDPDINLIIVELDNKRLV